MDRHLKEYYQSSFDGGPRGNFHKVIALHEGPDVGWEQIAAILPVLPKGWFEVAQLTPKDRIDFISGFWFKQLPFRPNLGEALSHFFEELDDIGIFVTQQKFDDPFEVHMAYSCANDGGFFRGHPPATEEELSSLKNWFAEFIMPRDYLSFLQIHNGFHKHMDTGVLRIAEIVPAYETLQRLLSEGEILLTEDGEAINPKSLIPFYESFGMHCYQCFWGEWYPENEMGNVYYSGLTRSISSFKKRQNWADNMAFPTFLDWLMFYIERIE